MGVPLLGTCPRLAGMVEVEAEVEVLCSTEKLGVHRARGQGEGMRGNPEPWWEVREVA